MRMKRQYLHTAILLLLLWCGKAIHAEAADVNIDLGTVTNSDTGGGTYTVAGNLITLTGAGNTYIFTQSGGTGTTTSRGILVSVSCNIKLNGVNISLGDKDALYVSADCTVNLTFAGDNTLNVTTANSALFSKGNLTLAGASGNADVLRCLAPTGNGINSEGNFTLSSGTVYAEGGGIYYGIVLSGSGKTANFSGGTVVAKGASGISNTSGVIDTIGENATLTGYGKEMGIGSNTAVPRDLLTRTIRWKYAAAPSTTDETVLTVKNTAGNVVRTLNLPAGYRSFGCTLPAGSTYTLWLRDGATDTQLKASDGTTDFAVGTEYSGLTPVAAVDPTEVEIDLSTVTTGGADYGVSSDVIALNMEGKTYILTQSGTAKTSRRIIVYKSCDIKLRGVNISIATGDVFFVNETCTVNLAFEGDNTLRTGGTNTALAAVGKTTLSAVNGNADILRCIAPIGNGINIKKAFTLNSGTVYATGGGGHNGIKISEPVAVNLAGGTVVAKGVYGIVAGNGAAVTLGDNLDLTAYGTTGSINTADPLSPFLTRTIRWSYATEPTDETVLTVKNSAGQEAHTFTLPAGYENFACNLPDGNYTLWQRDGATDTQLKTANGTTDFTVGTAYTGLTTEVEIDLSTVANSTADYAVASNLITLSGAGNTYILTQSGTAATTRAISVTKSCNVKLRGVNIGIATGDALAVAEGTTVNLTFEGDNTLRTESANCALAAVGTVTLSAANSKADVLRCIAPKGNGIITKGDFTLNSGTVYAEGGGDYNGIQMISNNKRVNLAGGTVVAKGAYGILMSNAAIVTMGDNLDLTAYGTTGSINLGNLSSPLLTKTVQWKYDTAPSTTDETVLTVKNSQGQEVRTFNLPAGYKGFACTLPAGDTYTLWLRDGATDTQLKASDGTTDFAVGGNYTGLTPVASVVSKEVEIDLSTVTADGEGYTVAADLITLNGEGNTYLFTQSGGTATTTSRAILVNASCSIKLSGVNLSVSGKHALEVAYGCTVDLTFEGDNTLTSNLNAISTMGTLTLSAVNGKADVLRCTSTGNSGISLYGSLTLNSGTVYANGGEESYGLYLFTAEGTINLSGGTLIAKGSYGIQGANNLLATTIGDGFSLTAYGEDTGIQASISDQLLTKTIRWIYAAAPSSTDETLLVVKNTAGNVVRTLVLPAGYKGFACTLGTDSYTLWQRDMATKTDTRLQAADGTTAFAVGTEYTGLTLTDVTQSFATTPMVAYTTAEGEQTPIDFTNYFGKEDAVGLLKDAVTLHISGAWNTTWWMKALRAAIDNNTEIASTLGSNATLTTVTFDPDTEMTDMAYLFCNCTALTSVTLPTKENTSGVRYTGTFSGCTALKSVDLSRVTNISGMGSIFEGCTVLESVKMPTVKNSNPVGFGNAFVNCPALKSVDLSAFTNISDMYYAFTGSPVLESVTMPTEPNATAVPFDGAFQDCPALKSVDLSGFTNISSLMGTFVGCPVLTSVKLGGAVPTNTGRTFYNANPNCLVYVPAGWTTKPTDGWDIIYIAGSTTLGDVAIAQDKPFRCPEAFTVAPGSRITYTRDFGTEPSGIGGNAAGWETISLPFTPTEIAGINAADSPVTLSPFRADGTYEGKGTTGVVPFWLRTLGAEKYTPATAIEPHKPYIIALPNNEAYDPKFNVTGTVTFSAVSTEASPVTVGATPEAMPSAAGSQYTLHANYATVAADPSVYVINPEGTAFVANGGDALPFRPYVTANSPQYAPAQFVIGKDEGGATAIEEAVLMGRDGDVDGFRVYGGIEPGSLVVETVDAATVSTVDVVAVDGRTVRTVSLHEGVNVVDGLAAGVYVVGGQKAVVR